MTEIEIIANDRNLCGEAPIWNAREGTLCWVDMSSSLVFQIRFPGTEKTILSDQFMVAGLALNRDETLIFAGANGMHIWSSTQGCRTFLVEHEGETLFFNDIVADSRGRIYAGTCYWGPTKMEKTGKLYLIEKDLSVTVVDDGIELSNGLGLSSNGRTLYYSDSTRRRIYAYDVDVASGALSGKRVFHQAPIEAGLPDGLTVDSEDHVWCAHWYGAQVVRYDPDGHVKSRISMPVKQVSSLAFGGAELSDLYVTSAAEVWNSSYAPAGFDMASCEMGGAVFRVRTDVQGRAEHVAQVDVPTDIKS
ncbi:N/A [soil metagenome]